VLCPLAPALAATFEPGDIVIPGDRVVDSFGSVNGCFYRLRDGQITRWFDSAKFFSPGDMVIDAQDRLVFWARPASGNVNEQAVFRIDPGSGSLERLFRFPYIVAVTDTMPDGAEDVSSFYGAYAQSMHLEKSFAIEINDDENGGWPQVSQPECYGFSIGTTFPSGGRPMAYRWRTDTNRCEVGTDVSLLLPYSGPVYMATGNGQIYYGLNDVIGQTQPASRLSVHLDGSWGSFDAALSVTPKNEIWIAGGVFDNTTVPNGTVDCGQLQDDDVPFASVGGCCFQVLSMNGLGVLDGGVYATSNSGATGVPYVFSIATRPPYLNPYICQYMPAMAGSGPLPFNLPDGTPTSATLTATDSGGLLGNGGGTIRRVTPAGDHSILVTQSGDQRFTGRPWRWNGPATKQIVSASKDAAGAQVLVLRADAVVNVLLTDGLGRQLGFDVDGNPVNDFGASGQTLVGPGGWPKLLALRDPELGISSVDVHAIAAGDWSIQAYLSHETAGGYSTTTLGSAAGPEDLVRGLYLGNPLGASWHQSPTSAELPETSRVSFVAGPVPAKGEVVFRFRAPDAGARVELAIFDLRGRRVAIPLAPTERAGLTVLDWDGRSSGGHRLARGVYMARLVVDGQQHIQRIVLAP
jgi:hypothetical protein